MTLPAHDLAPQLAAVRATAASNGHILDLEYADEDCWTQECVACRGYLQHSGRLAVATAGLDVRCPEAGKEAGIG